MSLVLLPPSSLVRFSNLKGPLVRASHFSVSGSGTCVSNAVLIQTRSCWEVTIVESGVWWIGVTRKSKEGLDKQLGERDNSWGLFSGPVGNTYAKGDILSISFDLSGIRAILAFSLNGVPMPHHTIDNVRGDVYPAVSVSDGAQLQANFGASGEYKFGMPNGFETIILSKDLI